MLEIEGSRGVLVKGAALDKAGVWPKASVAKDPQWSARPTLRAEKAFASKGENGGRVRVMSVVGALSAGNGARWVSNSN